jgi:hypothetical protein
LIPLTKGGRDMRKIVFAIMLVFALSIGYAVTKSTAHEKTSKSGETSEVSKLFGKTVKNGFTLSTRR